MDKKSEQIICYHYPLECPARNEMELFVDGEKVSIYQTEEALFSCIAFAGKINVCIKTKVHVKGAVVRPGIYGIIPDLTDHQVEFTLTDPVHLCIEIVGMPVLLFYANALEANKPLATDPKVHYFKSGSIYDIDTFHLKDGETLYIEGGAIVRGCIRAENAKNINIRGYGIFDGSIYTRETGSRRSIVLENCENVIVQDIIMIRPSSWMLVLARCNHVRVFNLKQIGEVITSDGIDIVGSKNVQIKGCFLRNNDDCIAIKSVMYGKNDVKTDWRGNVDNILVENCVFMNMYCGNAVEIGYETQADYIQNIIFRNCDILSVHGYGAAFAIHNGDRACISNILYENFRVEHYFDKLIDFRIVLSRYNKDAQRGSVHNIHLKDIYITCNNANPGCSISVIGGYDEHHKIEGVVIENLYLNNDKVTNHDQLELYTRCVDNIIFK